MESTDSENINAGDRKEGPYRGVGYDLRRARFAANLSVEEICNAIRISDAHLQAIEDGRFAELPGPTYVSGFVRTYAGYVGLHPDEIISRLKAETDVPKLKPEDLHFPEPERESRAPSPMVVIIGLLFAGLLYGGWYYFRQADWAMTGDRELVADVPARLQQQVPAATDNVSVSTDDGGESMAGGRTLPGERPTRAEFYNSASLFEETAELPAEADGAAAVIPRDLAGSSDVTQQGPGNSAQISETIATPPATGTTSDTAIADEATAETEMIMRVPSPKPLQARDKRMDSGDAVEAVGIDENVAEEVISPVPGGQGQMVNGGDVQLRALDSVWIQLSSASGEVLLARVLAADEVVPVPDETGVRLTASDAGALVAILRGERLPALGAAGEILRDLSLDPAALRGRVNR